MERQWEERREKDGRVFRLAYRQTAHNKLEAKVSVGIKNHNEKECAPDNAAEVSFGALAKLTLPTLRNVQWNNMVTCREVRTTDISLFSSTSSPPPLSPSHLAAQW